MNQLKRDRCFRRLWSSQKTWPRMTGDWKRRYRMTWAKYIEVYMSSNRRAVFWETRFAFLKATVTVAERQVFLIISDCRIPTPVKVAKRLSSLSQLWKYGGSRMTRRTRSLLSATWRAPTIL